MLCYLDRGGGLRLSFAPAEQLTTRHMRDPGRRPNPGPPCACLIQFRSVRSLPASLSKLLMCVFRRPVAGGYRPGAAALSWDLLRSLFGRFAVFRPFGRPLCLRLFV